MIVLTTRSSFFLKDRLPKGCTHRPPLIRIVSRLNYKPEGLKFELASEKISDLLLTPSRKSFEECCYDRAIEIERLPYDKIFLSYSGGIDSTLSLISFFKYWKPESLDRLTVLMNLSSIEENPFFFKHIIERVKVESIFQNYSQRLVTENAGIVTGEHGDQLFGSDIIGAAVAMYGDSAIHDSYEKIVPSVLNKFTENPDVTSAFFARLHPMVDESPFPLKSVHDFLWWYNLTMKWQYVKYRFLANKAWHKPAETAPRVHHFFDTVDFQKWSLSNHDQKIKGTWESYKFPMKELIFEYNKDAEYLRKKKVPSLPLTQMFMEYNDAFDRNFVSLTKEQVLSYVLE